jgi:hypothetical protein
MTYVAPPPPPHPNCDTIQAFTRFSKESCYCGGGGGGRAWRNYIANEEINRDVVIKHLNRARCREGGWHEVTTLYPPSLHFPSCLNVLNNDTYYGLLSRFLHGRGRHQYVERGGGTESQGTSQRSM